MTKLVSLTWLMVFSFLMMQAMARTLLISLRYIVQLLLSCMQARLSWSKAVAASPRWMPLLLLLLPLAARCC